MISYNMDRKIRLPVSLTKAEHIKLKGIALNKKKSMASILRTQIMMEKKLK